MDLKPTLSDPLINYKSVYSKRTELAQCYQDQGYTYIESSFRTWEALIAKIKEQPESDVVYLAFEDPYGSGFGRFKPTQFCSNEIEEVVRQLKKGSRLDWSGVAFKPRES